MKNLTTAIFGKLSGSALNTSIGGRLYKGRAPEDTTYPYIVYMVVTDDPEKTFSEDYENVLLQFSIFSTASGTTEIEDIFTNLKALYDECSLTITSSTLVWMKRSTAAFIPEEHTTKAGTIQVWHYAVDYEIMTSLD